MFTALFILAIPSIFIGFCTKDMIVGVGSDFFGAAIYNNPKTLHVFDAEFVEFFYKILPVTLSLFGAGLSFILYNFQSSILFNIKISPLGRKVYTFLNKKWFFDKLYNELFGQFFFKFGYTISYKSVDRGAFEIMGPAGLSSVALSVAHKLHKAQTGSLYHYTLLILATIASILTMRQIWLIFAYDFDYRALVLIFITFFFILSSEK
jgi:NADH-ubiquinone oxidoreductase chain 5